MSCSILFYLVVLFGRANLDRQYQAFPKLVRKDVFMPVSDDIILGVNDELHVGAIGEFMVFIAVF